MEPPPAPQEEAFAAPQSLSPNFSVSRHKAKLRNSTCQLSVHAHEPQKAQEDTAVTLLGELVALHRQQLQLQREQLQLFLDRPLRPLAGPDAISPAMSAGRHRSFDGQRLPRGDTNGLVQTKAESCGYEMAWQEKSSAVRFQPLKATSTESLDYVLEMGDMGSVLCDPVGKQQQRPKFSKHQDSNTSQSQFYGLGNGMKKSKFGAQQVQHLGSIGLRSELIERELMEAAWIIEKSNTRRLFSTNDHLPWEMPWSEQLALFFAGVVSPHHLRVTWHRLIYQLYCKSIPICFLSLGLSNVAELYAKFFVLGEPDPQKVVVAFLSMILLPIVWVAGKKQFGLGGASLALLQQMACREFQFDSLWWHLLAARIVVIVAVVVDIIQSSLMWSSGNTPVQNALKVADDDHMMAARIACICWLTGRLGLYATLNVGANLVWIVKLNGKLHRHDLLTYARIVASALEENDGTIDIVPLLKKLETTVTNRLFLASYSWVRWVVLSVCYFGLITFGMFTYLIVTKDLPLTRICLLAYYLIVMVTLIVVLALPLASVAEAFEYDVLHFLNNPVVLNRAQLYFGQSFLVHLKTLDWGFRFQGSVVNDQMVMNFILFLVVTVVGTVSQALFSGVESRFT